jgi:NADPH:quinone reductase-like Zn-dependent oxidoreductase
MPKAVRFDKYGGTEVLQVVEVERPTPLQGEVLVRVKAAGINPSEAGFREGFLHRIWPATFPSGEGTDFAGIVAALGPGVSQFAVGDEVIGYTAVFPQHPASHADFVVVPADNLTPRPANVSWEAAGSLYVAGSTAMAAIRAVGLQAGETLVVANAAGGVGSLVVQLAVAAGATVIGLASPAHHPWLTLRSVIPVAYGDGVALGVAERIRAVAQGPIDAFIDTYGAHYVEVALALDVRPDRIDTIANFDAPAHYGVKAEGGSAIDNERDRVRVLADLAEALSQGTVVVPIAHVYALDEVQAAYRELAQGHTLGKIVLVP